GSAPASSHPNIYTIAGTGVQGTTDGVQAMEAALDRPRSMGLTTGGGFAWAEPYDNDVRAVGADGVVTRVAGTGVGGYSGDGGPATQAQLNFVHGAVRLTDGSIVIADELNNRIRRVTSDGTITTATGDGTQGYGGEGGPATQA